MMVQTEAQVCLGMQEAHLSEYAAVTSLKFELHFARHVPSECWYQNFTRPPAKLLQSYHPLAVGGELLGCLAGIHRRHLPFMTVRHATDHKANHRPQLAECMTSGWPNIKLQPDWVSLQGWIVHQKQGCLVP